MVEELDSRLKRCPCCGGETVLGSLYGCRPWVTYWLPRYRSLLSPFFSRRNIEKSGGFLLAKGREYWYRTPPAPNQSYYCPRCKLLLTGWTSSAPHSHNIIWQKKRARLCVRRARGDCR